MSKKMDKYIQEHKEALKRFHALTGEEKRKAEKNLRKLQDRMQSEHNVTFQKKDPE